MSADDLSQLRQMQSRHGHAIGGIKSSMKFHQELNEKLAREHDMTRSLVYMVMSFLAVFYVAVLFLLY